MQVRELSVVLICSLVLLLGVYSPAAEAKSPKVVVAVVEPRAKQSKAGELSYSVSIDGKELTTTLAILNGLSRPKGEHVAILVHQDIPIGTLGTLVSIASKAGYESESIVTFIFYAERITMLRIPGYQNVKFSVDPEVVIGLIH